MREIKELLILTKDYILTENNFCGLCSTLEEMNYPSQIISDDEEKFIMDYLTNHRPPPMIIGPPGYELESPYWWEPRLKEPRLKEPRLEFLTNLINKL